MFHPHDVNLTDSVEAHEVEEKMDKQLQNSPKSLTYYEDFSSLKPITKNH